MRDASILGGLVPDDGAAQLRIVFVSEGEASLHFAVRNGLPAGAMEVRCGVFLSFETGRNGCCHRMGMVLSSWMQVEGQSI